MGKEEILFKKGIKIQGLNRVAIPKELLENMGPKEGDNIALYFNPSKNVISMRKEVRIKGG
jgi:bifunctional DNA-binding transcriptional regulator/antitoxin component of YhaV-PrlF toxin-antitoxin module